MKVSRRWCDATDVDGVGNPGTTMLLRPTFSNSRSRLSTEDKNVVL